jgi:hypothetical protein
MEDHATVSAADERASAQLAVLGQVDGVLSALHVRHWLRGGWAIDFLLGRITRPHADLDLVIWARHRERARHALLNAGFELARETAVQTDFRRRGHDMSVVYLERGSDGNIVTHGIPGWVWRADALPLRRWFLHGVSSRVVSPAQLIAEKEGYERGTSRPLRPKDVESIAVLHQIEEVR